jgi:hypothetical protein
LQQKLANFVCTLSILEESVSLKGIQATEANNNNNNNNNNNKGSGKEVEIQSLCIEIQRMWSLKCAIIQVIIGATEIVTRSLKKNLEAVTGKHLIDSLQKAAILGTSHIIRKVLQCEA